MSARESHQTGRRKRSYRQGARAQAAQQTRESILDAAAYCFAIDPYDAVSLEEIAAAASVTVQSVLRIFGSKEALFEAAAERAVKQVNAERDAALAKDPRAAIETLCNIYERWGDATHRVIGQEDRVPSIRAVAERGRSYHRQWVRSLFGKRLAGASRTRRLAVLVTLLDLDSYRRLRAQGLGARATQQALYDAAMALCR
jgi:AcrR family transcriptional regulator